MSSYVIALTNATDESVMTEFVKNARKLIRSIIHDPDMAAAWRKDFHAARNEAKWRGLEVSQIIDFIRANHI